MISLNIIKSLWPWFQKNSFTAIIQYFKKFSFLILFCRVASLVLFHIFCPSCSLLYDYYCWRCFCTEVNMNVSPRAKYVVTIKMLVVVSLVLLLLFVCELLLRQTFSSHCAKGVNIEMRLSRLHVGPGFPRSQLLFWIIFPFRLRVESLI